MSTCLQCCHHLFHDRLHDAPMCRSAPIIIRTQDTSTRKTTTPLRFGTHQVHRLSLTSTHRSPHLEALDPGRGHLRLLLPHGWLVCIQPANVNRHFQFGNDDGRMTDWATANLRAPAQAVSLLALLSTLSINNSNQD